HEIGERERGPLPDGESVLGGVTDQVAAGEQRFLRSRRVALERVADETETPCESLDVCNTRYLRTRQPIELLADEVEAPARERLGTIGYGHDDRLALVCRRRGGRGPRRVRSRRGCARRSGRWHPLGMQLRHFDLEPFEKFHAAPPEGTAREG